MSRTGRCAPGCAGQGSGGWLNGCLERICGAELWKGIFVTVSGIKVELEQLMKSEEAIGWGYWLEEALPMAGK